MTEHQREYEDYAAALERARNAPEQQMLLLLREIRDLLRAALRRTEL